MRKIDTIVIHHSASHSGNAKLFAAEHIEKGFGHIGYHCLIGNGDGMADGQCVECLPDATKGAGVFGANTGKLHVCLVGQFAPDCASPLYMPPTTRQLRALGLWLLNKVRQYNIAPENIKGHKEVAIPGHGTKCPGDFPLAKTRSWVHLWMHKVPSGSLDTFLAYKPSSDVSSPQARPGAQFLTLAGGRLTPQLQVIKPGVPGSRLVQCRQLDQGVLWAPVKDLVYAMGRAGVHWDSHSMIATVDASVPVPPPESSTNT